MSRILFLSRWFPYPPNNGSRLRIFSLLRALHQEHEIILLTFSEGSPDRDHIQALRSFCNSVRVIPWRPYNPSSARALLGLFSAKPRSIVDTFSREMQEAIENTIATEDVDLVVASEIDMAAYRPFFQWLPAIIEDIEVGVLHDQVTESQSLLQRLRASLMWNKYRRYLRSLLYDYDACTVVSSAERAHLSNIAPGYDRFEIIPNCVNLAHYGGAYPQAEPNTLIYTGSFTYSANYHAMTWFLHEIFPRIREKAPGVTLTITGDHANLPLPTYDNVVLTGMVDDIRPLVASSWIALAPILEGAGTRLKILEAMALRTPVVSTSKGAEGLPVDHEEHILIADTDEAFAEAIVRLLDSPSLRRKLTEQAYHLVARQFDWDVIAPKFLQLVHQVAIPQSALSLAADLL